MYISISYSSLYFVKYHPPTPAKTPLLFLLLLLSRFSRVRLCATPETAAHQAPRPWDSPGKNTGMDCHFLLQCVKVKSESEVIQSCLTLRDPVDCSLPGSTFRGIFQARVLEWGAIAFSQAHVKLGFPGGASGKEPGCQCRRHKRCGFNPWLGKIPWRRA